MGIRKYLRRAAGIAALSLSAATVVLLPATSAFATQAVPTAYYVTSTNTSTMWNYGCGDGTYDAGHGNANRLTVLDFGGQNSSDNGSITVSTHINLSNSQIQNLALNYAAGYYNCTGSDTTSVVDVAIGTNNSGYNVSTAGGQSWANLVNTIYNAIPSGEAGQVAIYGANDLETEWSSSSSTKAWASGYGSNTFYFDFGDAGGCSQIDYTNSGCNNGWNQNGVWWVSWGASGALPLPEVYYQSQANQWAQLSMYAYTYEGGAMNIEGPTSEYKAKSTTFTPTASWNALWGTLNNDYSQTAQSMSWLTDMSYE